MMPDNAASPVSVRDHLCGAEWGFGTSQANRFCIALGIDPDSPVEMLRRRLLWGERVEQVIPKQWMTVSVTTPDDPILTTARALLDFLTRPENPPSPCERCEADFRSMTTRETHTHHA